MPRLFSRLPTSLHNPLAKALLALAVLCAILALFSLVEFSQTTETSGHFWWKKTREIPIDERRVYGLIGVGLIVAAVFCVVGVVELVVAQARSTDARLGFGTHPDTSLPFVLARAAGRSWRSFRGRRADALTIAATRRDQARAAVEWRRYERSTLGKAEIAHERGDEFFSVELEVDGELAQHLNVIHAAGWRQQSVSRRHRKTTNSDPLPNGTHEVTGESVEIRTYIFRRNS